MDQVTLEDCARRICAALTGPTVVVGHSAGGYAITAAAEHDPAQISALVYLCAYIPSDGRSLAQMRRDGPSQPLLPALQVNAARSLFHFEPDQVDDLFYHDCDADARAMAAGHLCPEATRPQETPLHLSARSQSLPRHAILCTQDRAIPPAYQAKMASGLPSACVTALPASHSPFFSMPEAFAARIDAIVRQGGF